MSGDISKLPKWAQAELVRLTRENLRLQTERDELAIKSLGPDHTNTILASPFYHEEPDINLPNGAMVRFRIGLAGRGNLRVRVNRNGELEVNGDAGLVIRPEVSNAVRITLNER